MYIKLVLLFLVAAVTIQGEDDINNVFFGSTKYADDAAIWADLHHEYLIKSPYKPLRGQFKFQCRIVKECCPSEMNNIFSMINENRFEKSCIGTQGSKLYNSLTTTCHGLVKSFHDSKKTAEYSKAGLATHIPPLNDRFKEWRSQMVRTCSTDELTAYFCEPLNMDSFRSCAEKVLREIDRKDGSDAYNTFFQHIKTDYHTLVERITKAFPYDV
ncbi:unnamed protein product [Adineta steineri]|uniref:Uncharacterized protein n=1 Tax=Adineta steineri TaxID=433720 RepID=A0A813PKJ3_9BILA|nr:unnamed protein product [Adineta steineri]CAF4228408.1 unnamed protein product [Adineta steineri]